jgi:hypothetical protein
LMGLLAFCTYKPNFLANLGLIKECVALLAIRHDTTRTRGVCNNF